MGWILSLLIAIEFPAEGSTGPSCGILSFIFRMLRVMIPVLFEDDSVIAVEKPSGLLVHPTDLTGREVTCVDIVSKNLGVRVLPVHRLDRKVSGVLLFAKNREIARLVGIQFQNREVRKCYLALVRGWTPESFEVDHEVPSIKGNVKRNAKTSFKCVATCEIAAKIDKYETSRFSLVEAVPLTGRYHQIRRHLKHADHPIVGDTVYGRGEYNRYFRRRFDYSGMALTSVGLTIKHPISHTDLVIRSGLSTELKTLLTSLGINVLSYAAFT